MASEKKRERESTRATVIVTHMSVGLRSTSRHTRRSKKQNEMRSVDYHRTRRLERTSTSATYNAVAYFKPGYKRGKARQHQPSTSRIHASHRHPKLTTNYERRKPKTKGKTRGREQSSQLGRIITTVTTQGMIVDNEIRCTYRREEDQ